MHANDSCLPDGTSMTASRASHAAGTDDLARQRSIAFLNWAHALDHFVLLIYPTVVIGLEVDLPAPYSELIALSSTAFVAFGVFSLPAGWLADRWSRRNMMAAFYIGCGLSLVGAGFAPNLTALAVAHVRARHIRSDLSSGRHGDADRGIECARAHARLQWRVRKSRRLACCRHQRSACHLVRLARCVLRTGRGPGRHRNHSISGSRPTTVTMPRRASPHRRCR